MKKNKVSAALRLTDKELELLNQITDKWFRGQISTAITYLVKKGMEQEIK